MSFASLWVRRQLRLGGFSDEVSDKDISTFVKYLREEDGGTALITGDSAFGQEDHSRLVDTQDLMDEMSQLVSQERRTQPETFNTYSARKESHRKAVIQESAQFKEPDEPLWRLASRKQRDRDIAARAARSMSGPQQLYRELQEHYWSRFHLTQGKPASVGAYKYRNRDHVLTIRRQSATVPAYTLLPTQTPAPEKPRGKLRRAVRAKML